MSATSIEVLGGRYVDVFNPKPEDFVIEDIAHALSHQCRFNGYTRRHYSVAEHSVYVARQVGAELARVAGVPAWESYDKFCRIVLQALLHDATEAYLVDFPRPIKHAMPEYAVIETALWKLIAQRFNVAEKIHPAVKEADLRMCSTEKVALLAPGMGADGEWVEYFKQYPPYGSNVVANWDVPPVRARHLFLEMYRDAGGV